MDAHTEHYAARVESWGETHLAELAVVFELAEEHVAVLRKAVSKELGGNLVTVWGQRKGWWW